ncbi:BMP family ABC transporter substrate-binding protein [Chlorogloea sp. CCALA 695]|uniref:BMP family ABC transporter substrate-binding protein n=1 Tax=Chlorogloea sp. CCALA 695 TaxID=2107693 RepID=UPI000D05DBC9|nr:BMP family ABC transporter substrate-binding protein [Chlorogloea sp. CCALA 695]PSB30233.1 BMP family ABC transporter substrate-binding protein [Chlorogloea sp. CCALA 695]
MSDSNFLYIRRRQFIRGILATTAFATTTKFGTGCSAGKQTQATSTGASSPVVMGFIYVGPKDDYGYNQAHAQGKAGVSKLEWVKSVEEANVTENTSVEETMRNMIEQDGVTVLFPTSFGYFDPHILKIAKEYPEVQFLHCGGRYEEGKHPNNVGSYFGYIDDAQYIAGIVAAHTSNSSKLGFIAAKPVAQVLRNINSFALGARSVKPNVTTQVIFTGDWSIPVKEAEAANSMADQGIDVVTCHVDSPKVVMETAEKRGIFSSGYHANQLALAPKGYLTGAEWDWTNIYSRYADMIRSGKTLMNGGIPHIVRGGLKDGFLKLSDYGTAVSAAAKKDADAAKAKFLDGSMVIYKGEVKDNTGKVVIPAGKERKQQDAELEKMNWLAAGVIGNVQG